MKPICILLISLIIYGCGVLNRMGDAIGNAMIIVLPDTCEISLLGEILKIREDSLKFPVGKTVLFKYEPSDSVCRDKFDSIYIYEYNPDSLDLKFRKNVIVDQKTGYVIKKYRIINRNDSIYITYIGNPGK